MGEGQKFDVRGHTWLFICPTALVLRLPLVLLTSLLTSVATISLALLWPLEYPQTDIMELRSHLDSDALVELDSLAEASRGLDRLERRLIESVGSRADYPDGLPTELLRLRAEWMVAEQARISGAYTRQALELGAAAGLGNCSTVSRDEWRSESLSQVSCDSLTPRSDSIEWTSFLLIVLSFAAVPMWAYTVRSITPFLPTRNGNLWFSGLTLVGVSALFVPLFAYGWALGYRLRNYEFGLVWPPFTEGLSQLAWAPSAEDLSILLLVLFWISFLLSFAIDTGKVRNLAVGLLALLICVLVLFFSGSPEGSAAIIVFGVALIAGSVGILQIVNSSLAYGWSWVYAPLLIAATVLVVNGAPPWLSNSFLLLHYVYARFLAFYVFDNLPTLRIDWD
jgi:hypothetical protein